MTSRFLLGLFFVGCIGCSQREVAENLSQQQSREILVLLTRAGIEANLSKSGSDTDAFQVRVPESEYQRSLELLHEFNLPRDPEMNVEVLTRTNGFMPNAPEIAALRTDYILSRDAEEQLARFLGDSAIVRVLVRSRGSNRSVSTLSTIGENLGPAASVVIRYFSPSGKFLHKVDDIKDIVARAVPGLTAERVTVNLSAGSSPSGDGLPFLAANDRENASEVSDLWPMAHGMFDFVNFRVATADRETARRRISALVFISAAAAFLLGIWSAVAWMSMRGKRRERNGRGRANANGIPAMRGHEEREGKQPAARPRSEIR